MNTRVTKIPDVHKRSIDREHLKAQEVIHSLLTTIPPNAHRIAHTPEDRAFIKAWHGLGARDKREGRGHSFWEKQLKDFSPMGQLSALAYACGFESMPLSDAMPPLPPGGEPPASLPLPGDP